VVAAERGVLLIAEDAQEQLRLNGFGILARDIEQPQLPTNRVRDQPTDTNENKALE